MPITIHTDKLDGELTWLTAPEDQGQMVQISYAGTWDGRVLRRVTDGSLNTTCYEIADLSAKEQDSDEPLGLNRPPRIRGKWRACTLIASQRRPDHE